MDNFEKLRAEWPYGPKRYRGPVEIGSGAIEGTVDIGPAPSSAEVADEENEPADEK